MVMSSAVVFAVKRAIESARKDAGNDDLVILCMHIHLFCVELIVIMGIVFYFSCSNDCRTDTNDVLHCRFTIPILVRILTMKELLVVIKLCQ